MTYITEHNAFHPYELHVCDLVEAALGSAPLPPDRFRVAVTFSPVLRSFAKHKLDLSMNGKRVEGSIELLYNCLYLMQDPVNFFEEAVPHEVAHVLNEIASYKSGIETLEHGMEWQDWLAKISQTASPSSTLPDTDFDERAILLHSGGVLGACECEDEARFHAYRNSGKRVGSLRKGEVECPTCGSTIHLTDLEEMPSVIRADIEYIQQDLQKRSTSL